MLLCHHPCHVDHGESKEREAARLPTKVEAVGIARRRWYSQVAGWIRLAVQLLVPTSQVVYAAFRTQLVASCVAGHDTVRPTAVVGIRQGQPNANVSRLLGIKGPLPLLHKNLA